MQQAKKAEEKSHSLFLSFLEVTWVMKMMWFSNNLVKRFLVDTVLIGLLCHAEIASTTSWQLDTRMALTQPCCQVLIV